VSERATRSRANPGGIQDVLTVLGPEVQPTPRAEASVVQGAGRSRRVPATSEISQLIDAENLHTVLPGGGLSEHRRVLAARHRDVHDPGDTCHAALRVLQRQDGQADLERPARAGEGGAIGPRGWGSSTLSSRASTGTICRITAHQRLWELSGRSAGSRRTRRSSVLTPDFRGEEMPLAKVIAEKPDVFNTNVEVVPRLYPVARRGSRFERSVPGAPERQGDGRRRGRDEVGPDGWDSAKSFEEMVDALGTLRDKPRFRC